MIWHDFMFACSEYPDDQEWFVRLVETEMDYQTRRLRNHPSMVLWCGNNEIHWVFDESESYGNYYGAHLYNYSAPSAIRKNCPDIPYWNSSPYGGEKPNGNEMGDRHHWFDCMMHSEMQKRITPEEYDKVTAKFVSEYGYVGPLVRSSIEKFLDGAPFDIHGEVWQHHNNTFEKDTVLAGIHYHYRDTEDMDIDRYLLYAGLCQGLMYGYSLEAFRFKENCHGGLFWMYADCWGETGWTIIDYYLTRKISYYFVKRAFAHTKFILRESDGEILVVGCNDGAEAQTVKVEYGYMSYDGKIKDTKTANLSLKAHSRELVMCFNKSSHEVKKGVFFVKAILDESIPMAILRMSTHRELDLPKSAVSIVKIVTKGQDVEITVRSDTFEHAVHFDIPDELRLSDNYFDMLPNQKCTVTVYGAAEMLKGRQISAISVN